MQSLIFRRSCLTTYDPNQSYYTNTAVNNAGRSWTWFTCTEVGFFQDGAPTNVPTIVSRLVQPAMDLVSLYHDLTRSHLTSSLQRTCLYMFGSNYKNGIATLPNTDATNTKYKGWNTTHPRIYFATGQRELISASDVRSFRLNLL